MKRVEDKPSFLSVRIDHDNSTGFEEEGKRIVSFVDWISNAFTGRSVKRVAVRPREITIVFSPLRKEGVDWRKISFIKGLEIGSLFFEIISVNLQKSGVTTSQVKSPAVPGMLVLVFSLPTDLEEMEEAFNCPDVIFHTPYGEFYVPGECD